MQGKYEARKVYYKVIKMKSGAVRIFVFYLIAFIIILMMIFPFYWMVSSSFKRLDEIFNYEISLLPEGFMWQNYIELSKTIPIFQYMKNTIFVALATVFIGLFINSLASYSFARLRFRGKEILFIVVLATFMIPAEVTLIPLFLFMKKIGWIDTFRALIVPAWVNAFGIFLLRQFFKQLPSQLVDAARIDGCSEFEIYLRVALPLAKPALITLGLFMFIWSWDAFMWPLIVTTSESTRVIQVGIAALTSTHSPAGIRWDLIMAATTIASLPTLALFFYFQKYYVRGIARTGIK